MKYSIRLNGAYSCISICRINISINGCISPKFSYSKNSFWVKSVFTPAAARTPSAAAIIN
jgi:hypothetical protein